MTHLLIDYNVMTCLFRLTQVTDDSNILLWDGVSLLEGLAATSGQEVRITHMAIEAVKDAGESRPLGSELSAISGGFLYNHTGGKIQSHSLTLLADRWEAPIWDTTDGDTQHDWVHTPILRA